MSLRDVHETHARCGEMAAAIKRNLDGDHAGRRPVARGRGAAHFLGRNELSGYDEGYGASGGGSVIHGAIFKAAEEAAAWREGAAAHGDVRAADGRSHGRREAANEMWRLVAEARATGRSDDAARGKKAHGHRRASESRGHRGRAACDGVGREQRGGAPQRNGAGLLACIEEEALKLLAGRQRGAPEGERGTAGNGSTLRLEPEQPRAQVLIRQALRPVVTVGGHRESDMAEHVGRRGACEACPAGEQCGGGVTLLLGGAHAHEAAAEQPARRRRRREAAAAHDEPRAAYIGAPVGRHAVQPQRGLVRERERLDAVLLAVESEPQRSLLLVVAAVGLVERGRDALKKRGRVPARWHIRLAEATAKGARVDEAAATHAHERAAAARP